MYLAPLNALRSVHARLLSAPERARADRFAHPQDRDRFVLGASLLRLVVATTTGIRPEEVQIDRSCAGCGRPHGRPRLGVAGLHASISHSGHLVAVASTDAGPVGVDIERLSFTEYGSLVQYVCTASERTAVREAADFFRYWTRKESVLKATGYGLKHPMTALSVSPPWVPPAVTGYGSGRLDARMIDLAPRRDYTGAVTVLTRRETTFRVRQARSLLATAG